MKALTAAILLTALSIPAYCQEATDLSAEFGDFGKAYKYHDKYKELTFQALKAAKESYEHKKVRYESIYTGFADTFPPYVEKSGYKSNKYFFLNCGGIQVPVLARKKKDLTELIGKLKKGVKVRIYGRVKEFRSKPGMTTLPRFFIELAHITVLEAKPGRLGGGGDKTERPVRRPFRRR